MVVDLSLYQFDGNFGSNHSNIPTEKLESGRAGQRDGRHPNGKARFSPDFRRVVNCHENFFACGPRSGDRGKRHLWMSEIPAPARAGRFGHLRFWEYGTE